MLAIVLPLAPPVPTFQVPVAAAFAVLLTGLVLCAAATAAVLAAWIGEVGITSQATPAVAVRVAAIALEPGLNIDILSERGAPERAETSNGQPAGRGSLEHAASVGLRPNQAREMVETIGIHAILSLSIHNCALNRTVRV